MKLELKFGIVTGLLMCAWVMVQYFFGFHNDNLEAGKYSGYFATLIPIATIYLLLKQKREMEFAGFLSMRQGLRAGTIMAIITAMITTIFFLIYNHYINPGWMEHAMEWERVKLLQKGLPVVQINEQIARFKTMNTDFAQIIQGFMGSVMMGIVITLFLSLTLRRIDTSKINQELNS